MSTFDINQIIDQFKLDETQVAKELFPTNMYPSVAFKRITSGKAFLDTNQVVKLADILGMHAADLFKRDTWSISIPNKERVITFKRNSFRVEYATDTRVCSLYKGEGLKPIEVIFMAENMRLSNFLETLDKTIANLI